MLAITLILGVAAYLRLTQLDLVEFKLDEATVSAMSLAMARGQSLPLVGNMSSLGTNNPPIFVYLMAVPYLFTDDPSIATGFVGLLGVVAVFGCYRLARVYFGELAALIASLLFAVSPWAAMYSRKIWPQDVLPLFGVLYASALYAYAVRRRSWRLPLAFLWLALSVQIHPASIALAPVLILVLLCCRSAFRWRPFLVGLVISVASATPYIAWQAAHEWIDLKRSVAVFGQPGTWDGAAARAVFDTVAARADYAEMVAGDEWLYGVQGVAFIVSLLYVLYLVASRKKGCVRRPALVILILWLVTPIGVFSRHAIEIHPYYLLQVYPAQFIVVGIALADLFRVVELRSKAGFGAPWSRRVFGSSAIGILVSMLAAASMIQIAAVTAFIGSLDTGPRYAEYGLPLRETVAAARAVADDERKKDTYLVLGERGYDFVSAFDFVTGGKLRARELDGRWMLVLPTGVGGQAEYVVNGQDTPAARLLEKGFHSGRTRAVGQVLPQLATTTYRIAGDAAGRVLQSEAFRSSGLATSVGVQMIGWQASKSVRAGETLLLTAAWQVGAAQERSTKGYSFFAHLVDTLHVSWGGFDTARFQPGEWNPGDTLVSWLAVPVSADAHLGQYWLDFGLYDRLDRRRIPLARGTGEPASDSIQLGPIKVVPSGDAPLANKIGVGARQQAWLEDQVQLLGYDLEAAGVKPGAKVTLTLLWRAGTPKTDYTVFVHVVSDAGRLVAQSDSPPHLGAYPTSMWDEGELVRDEYDVAVPADAPEGAYRIVVGMYDARSGNRLKTVDAAGKPIGDSIELGEKVVVMK